MSCAFELEVDKILNELSAADDDADDDAHSLDGPIPAPMSRSLADRYNASYAAAYNRTVAKARDIARRILAADGTRTIERLVLDGYKQLSSPWRALVQRAQQVHQAQCIGIELRLFQLIHCSLHRRCNAQL